TLSIVYPRLIQAEEKLRAKHSESSKLWKEQFDKHYLKSLDYQGINFRQNDLKNLQPKLMLFEIIKIFNERQDKQINAFADSSQNPFEPHLVLVYQNKAMIEVACNLIIHYVKRQTSINAQIKKKIKNLMRKLVPDFFGTPPGDLSDDESETNDTIKNAHNSLGKFLVFS